MNRNSCATGLKVSGRQRRRQSFTLVEMLLVISIIVVLASTTMFALQGTMEQAKAARTRAQIAKLHEFIMSRWGEYSTRAVETDVDPLASSQSSARARLLAVRQLMRMELPDRKSDLVFYDESENEWVPESGIVFWSGARLENSLWRQYLRMAQKRLQAAADRRGNDPPWNWDDWSTNNQGSECLYLIVAAIRDEDSSGLDFFRDSEIGDTDGDGMLEILDGWGRPIKFLRWAPGYTHLPGSDGEWGNAGVDDDEREPPDDMFERGWPGSDDEIASDIQSFEAANTDSVAGDSPDPFDPLKVDPRWGRRPYEDTDPTNDPFALYPLIYSAGQDGIYDVAIGPKTGGGIRYSRTRLLVHRDGDEEEIFWPNDPYYTWDSEADSPSKLVVGLPQDLDGDGVVNAIDNITNHQLGASL